MPDASPSLVGDRIDAALREWAADYFGQYPQAKIELIMLYQAVPAVDLQAKTTPITHYFLPVAGPNFAGWQAGKPARRLTIHPLIGTVQSKPTSLVLSDGVRTGSHSTATTFSSGRRSIGFTIRRRAR